MGKMTLQLPAGLPPDAARELERCCLTGGPDNMPTRTAARLDPGALTLTRDEDESGYLLAPWGVDGVGRFMGTSATLMVRPRPYNLLLELARGKINQVRCQASDWQREGLQIGPLLQHEIREATAAFGRAVVAQAGADADLSPVTAALALGYRAAERLVADYVTQVFTIRHQRQPRLETSLSCPLGLSVPAPEAAENLLRSVNALCVPLSWDVVEKEEGDYRWDTWDTLVEWATARPGVEVTAGPLIDFSSARLPPWLWHWERDVPGLAAHMGRYVEFAVRRYRHRIRRWQVTAGSNSARVLGLGEDELFGLTYRLVETARQVDPGLELSVGLAQPWGEYLAQDARQHSPFIFADNLLRAGLNLWALDLEIVMGVAPRGSYCRDLLETSRILDLYNQLRVPLRVTLGYPSAAHADPPADPELHVGAGRWRDGFTPQAQGEWAAQFGALTLCKPQIYGVRWAHFSDAEPHQFPHCGLFDADGRPKPALDALRHLRQTHLR